MQKKIFQYALLAAIMISAAGSWLAEQHAITASVSSPWVVSIIWFSLFATLLFWASIVSKDMLILEIVAIVSFLLSLYFAFDIKHLLIIAIAVALLLAGLHNVRSDLDLNVKISLWKSLRVGKWQILLALTLVISSQYYFTISGTAGQKTIPSIDLQPILQPLVAPVLGFLNPSLKSVQQDSMTVDQFILKSQEGADQSLGGMAFSEDYIDSQIPQDLPVVQREALKQSLLQQVSDSKKQLDQKKTELVLSEGRKQLSQVVGQPLTGQEKISEVFAGMVDKKINDYFQAPLGDGQANNVFPFILTTILFLTILPLGSVLSTLWFLLAIGFFKLCVRLGLVKIEKTTVEKEMIA
ncbi:MAG TPA: hypothetical protein VF817_03150 [Patescibacteria group bacterium]